MSNYNSGELPLNQPYTLEKYRFELRTMYDDENDITGVVAKMTADGETETQGIDIEGRTSLLCWIVEATDTEASVYVKKSPLYAGDGITVPPPAASVATVDRTGALENGTFSYWVDGNGLTTQYTKGQNYCVQLFASAESGLRSASTRPSGDTDGSFPLNKSFTYDGKTVYWGLDGSQYYTGTLSNATPCCGQDASPNDEVIAWMMIYGVPSSEKILVGRFDIDLSVDPEPDLPDPGDNWEEPESTGDPDYTLKVRIVGALSGRHNDPLRDTSYSFTPSDQISVKGYGGGGDGGHGGGGGAGASTIIVRRFVTDKAGSIEVTAISKRHGYGSGGGKGGRGGDGCILVFY